MNLSILNPCSKEFFMYKPFLIAGTIFGLLSVVLGAFGAHALQQMISDEKLIHAFQTGVQYQVFHAFALLAVGILHEKFPSKLIRWSGKLFVAGIILFSGSLYLLAFLNGQGGMFGKIIGPLTPIGGVLFILGWFFLLIVVMKKRESKG